MNTWWFRLSFFINNEQIEPNLNGVFTNKYGKIQCWLTNFEKFWIVMISLLRIFIYNQSIQKIYLLSGFGFNHLESHQSYFWFFSGFKVFSQ